MNVLGELFGNIANAIRSKAGIDDNIKFKPAEFAEQIMRIPTGNGEALSLDFKVKSFEATDNTMTVEHNMGKVPDIIIMWPGEPATYGYMTMVYGFSQALMYAITDAENLYPAKGGYCINGASGLISMIVGTSVGFDKNQNDSNSVTYGLIRNVTKTSFTVGTNNNYLKLNPGTNYAYVAITGLFS